MMETMNSQNQIVKTTSVAYIDDMPKHEYTAVYKKEGRWIVAWIEEVPGANTQARTMKEAKENLREVLMLVLEENRKLEKSKTPSIKREKFIINTED
jgi:predicted RNase H-like HicB family nuclease